MKRRWLSALLVCLALCSVTVAQESKKPLALEEIESLLKQGVTGRAVVSVIDNQGVKFEVSETVKERLRKAGADDGVIAAVERASLDYARKKLEAERQQFETEKKRAEEARQEEEKKVAAEAKRKGDEEKKQQEQEVKRQAEEKRRATEAKRQEEAAQRRAEEEQRKVTEARQTGEMVQVPAGEFFMGCNENVDTECDGDEKPGRRVPVAAFKIDRTEVTVGQYSKCVQAGACTSPDASGGCNYGQGGRENYPVNCVDWSQADAYCRWAGKRLPTEAEWEKAARGTDGRVYPWGNQWDSKRANDNSLGMKPVGSFSAGSSPYGALDMAGNVWEWMADWYNNSRNTRSARGGAWAPRPLGARASPRGRYVPGLRGGRLGVRCAR